MTVNLPYRPTAVRWQTGHQPGGNDWSLEALITYAPEQVAVLARGVKPGGVARIPNDTLRAWFPTDLGRRYRTDAALAFVEGISGEATPFMKSPLIHGDMLLLEREAWCT